MTGGGNVKMKLYSHVHSREGGTPASLVMMAQVLMNKEGADQESFCSDYDDAVTSDSDTVAADSNGVPSPHHPCYSGGSTRHAV